MLIRQRFFKKNHEERVVEFIFGIWNPCSWFELAPFHKRIGNLFIFEILIGVNQGVLENELVELISQQFIV